MSRSDPAEGRGRGPTELAPVGGRLLHGISMIFSVRPGRAIGGTSYGRPAASDGIMLFFLRTVKYHVMVIP